MLRDVRCERNWRKEEDKADRLPHLREQVGVSGERRIVRSGPGACEGNVQARALVILRRLVIGPPGVCSFDLEMTVSANAEHKPSECPLSHQEACEEGIQRHPG